MVKKIGLSELSELTGKAEAKNNVTINKYCDYVNGISRVLLNYEIEDVNHEAYYILSSDFRPESPNKIQSVLLKLPVSVVIQIKELSSNVCNDAALFADLPTMTVINAKRTLKTYVSGLALAVVLVFCSSALFGQEIPVEWRKPFSEKVSEFWSHSNLCEATILVLFENQLQKDLGITVDFYCGELIMLVREDLILPIEWQKSIEKVLSNKEYMSDNIDKNK
jgi:hypothetical protein